MRPIPLTLLCLTILLAYPIASFCSAPPTSSLKVGEEVVLVSDGPGKKLRSQPALAFGQDIYLVAWQEGWHGDGGNSRIYAVRVGSNGKLLDPVGIEIAPCKSGVQENPRVAFFGGAFLVVWQDLRSGKDCDVLGARVSLEGQVLDSQPINIDIGPRTQALPDVTADDKGFMVVWHGFQGEETYAKIFAARVGRDGATERPLVVTEGAAPRIAWNGREHLLVYSRSFHHGTMAAGQARNWLRMDTTGKPLSEPELMWENSQYSVCGMPAEKGWLMMCPGGPPNFWGRSVGIQRIFQITPEGKLAADTPTTSKYNPKKGQPDPANWLDSSRLNQSEDKAWPWGGSALARAGKCCVAVWQRYVIGGSTGIALANGDIRASRVDGWKPLEKEGGVALAASEANEVNPVLAGNDIGELLCVYEKRLKNGLREICARTIDAQ